MLSVVASRLNGGAKMMKYTTNYDYIYEMKKLADGLIERGIVFKFHRLYDGFQILVYKNDNQIWDAICHSGSYGHETNLLEVAGSIVSREYEDDGYLVEGNLTAEYILSRLGEEKERKR